MMQRAAGFLRASPRQSLLASTAVSATAVTAGNAVRHYRHWRRCTPDDFGLPRHSMPSDIKDILKNPDSRDMGFLDTYWYWRVRRESNVLNPDKLATTSLKQLAKDMGMELASPPVENMIGLIELYEYLKSAPFVGPFGTIENPVLVPATQDSRVVGCTGGVGEDEHVALWFNCRQGFLYRCGECDQIFMLARVTYDVDDVRQHNPKDPDVEDAFDISLLESAHKMYNPKEGMVNWAVGAQAMGAVGTPIDTLDYDSHVDRLDEGVKQVAGK